MSRERDGSNERTYRKSSRQSDYLVKLSGIPGPATKDDVKKFLYPSHVVAVHMFDASNSSTSECFVDLETEDDVKDALEKSGHYLHEALIEVFRATTHEYNFHAKHKGMVTWREPVIRMSGLPFECIMAEVQSFFENVEIARNGIYITRDMADKALGDGFVAFVSMDNAYKAIDLYDQKRIQHRYIELFPSTYDEAKRKIMNDARSNARQFVGEDDDGGNKKSNGDMKPRSRSASRQRSRSTSRGYRERETKRRHSPSASPPPRARPPPKTSYQRSGNSNRGRNRSRTRSRSPARRSSSRNKEYLVKIRGMPYTVVEDDIRKFFPSSCQPVRIEIMQDRRMKRANGDGHLYFGSLEDIDEAMKYDRKYMGSRYIELYFDAPRYSSLNNRRKKRDDAPPPRRSSRSPPRSKINRRSRSRSDSMD